MSLTFVTPSETELALLRADPLLHEHELDVRPDVAEALEQASQRRAGRVYWRSAHDHLYALELGDIGRGRPSSATVYGFWDRYEPRPPEHEIDRDLLTLAEWVANATESIDASDVVRVAQYAGMPSGWPEGSVLRTPEARFANLPDFPYEPRYVEIEGLRMAYVDQGTGDPILMLHGEPTWGYLYRRMMPALSEIGRTIVPDLIGFGRSDKPTLTNAYTYRSHARWLRTFITELDLQRITLVCQDWGGLLGLRVLSQMPERFSRLAAMNTGLPDGEQGFGGAFARWRRASQRWRAMDVARMMRGAVQRHDFSEAEAAAYDAPFPSAAYQTGALVFPRLVPIRPDHPGAADNRRAIEVLRTLDLPVLLPWADGDPITRAGESALRDVFANVAPPSPIPGAGHFLQEDAGPEIAAQIRQWMSS